MKYRFAYRNLDDVYRRSPRFPLTETDSIVIFSDLHMGNGGRRDDFLNNGGLFARVLEFYYLEKNFRLILNGDIEELHKFRLGKIQSQWKNIYALFEKFSQNQGLIKTIGNHDYELSFRARYSLREELVPSLILVYKNEDLFLLHGHQASYFVERYNTFLGLFLRYVVKTLGIRNYSTAYDRRKKFRVEKKVHDFSKDKKIVSIIGHTHRPLFESLSKADALKMAIENLVREHSKGSQEEKELIETKIKKYRQELLSYSLQKNKDDFGAGLYDSGLIIPSLFNSGCGVGKRGITAIEITEGKIRLVHWFKEGQKKAYLDYHDSVPERLGESGICRIVLKEDFLDYILSRIRLLTS